MLALQRLGSEILEYRRHAERLELLVEPVTHRDRFAAIRCIAADTAEDRGERQFEATSYFRDRVPLYLDCLGKTLNELARVCVDVLDKTCLVGGHGGEESRCVITSMRCGSSQLYSQYLTSSRGSSSLLDDYDPDVGGEGAEARYH